MADKRITDSTVVDHGPDDDEGMRQIWYAWRLATEYGYELKAKEYREMYIALYDRRRRDALTASGS